MVAITNKTNRILSEMRELLLKGLDDKMERKILVGEEVEKENLAPVAALRSFSNKSGLPCSLYSHSGSYYRWSSGDNEAVCNIDHDTAFRKRYKGEDHHVAHPECTCGFYASYDEESLREHSTPFSCFIDDKSSITEFDDMFGLVSCYGHISHHSRGIRSSNMQIEAIFGDTLYSDQKDVLRSNGFKIIPFENWRDIAQEMGLRVMESSKDTSDYSSQDKPFGNAIFDYISKGGSSDYVLWNTYPSHGKSWNRNWNIRDSGPPIPNYTDHDYGPTDLTYDVGQKDVQEKYLMIDGVTYRFKDKDIAVHSPQQYWDLDKRKIVDSPKNILDHYVALPDASTHKEDFIRVDTTDPRDKTCHIDDLYPAINPYLSIMDFHKSIHKIYYPDTRTHVYDMRWVV